MNNSKTRNRPLIIAHCSIRNVTVLIFDGKTTETYGGTAPRFCMFHKRGLLPLPLWGIQNLGAVPPKAWLKVHVLNGCLELCSRSSIDHALPLSRETHDTTPQPILLGKPSSIVSFPFGFFSDLSCLNFPRISRALFFATFLKGGTDLEPNRWKKKRKLNGREEET